MKLHAPFKLVLCLSVAGLLLAGAGAAEDEDKNVKLYETLKCNMCHALERFGVEATVTKADMLGPDLGDVGSQRDAEWLKKWLLQEVELEGKSHKSKWKGTPKDLEAISAWLATLKK
ncbi:MAG TPA: hypothetical protein VMT85_12815 [Thermoanaerobaculia bacterium]|nr:hypothetical protein [Thermoanaerobaculia bacterium]